MHHSIALALLLAACASPKPTPLAHQAPRASYALQPLSLLGGEGRHSMSHSATRIGGTLTLVGDTAELALGSTTHVSHVHCSFGPNEFSRQQCAPPETKDYSTTGTRVLRGSQRMQDGVLHLRLAGAPLEGSRPPITPELELACSEAFLGLACAVTKNEWVFGAPWAGKPSTLTFYTPGDKRYALEPVDAKDVGRVTGEITVRGEAISVSLAVDGGTPVVLPGKVEGGGAMLFSAQTSATRTFFARCEGPHERLTCEVSADRSVLGKPEHFTGPIVLNAIRG